MRKQRQKRVVDVLDDFVAVEELVEIEVGSFDLQKRGILLLFLFLPQRSKTPLREEYRSVIDVISIESPPNKPG